MLKALELSGFKSFADDTRFDFPAGITVVVGPNGSGKSNIVDAIKWVLGAQSARALRGKEMADVIFKGSGSGSRKPANTAEATIVFENTDNIFGHDTEEVRVTRRVYRSGEGEYLINNQPCRLRDIKDMFRGTGVGADAYSLIEQGKVDSLLEASAKDRRAIFEEAAGISRFKAKKVEAQRRLERVEQNLLRLSDIVDEVDHRLRRLKSQAGKARRYREYSDRLQSLRTQVGRVDWQRLSNQLADVELALQGSQTRLAEGGAELQAMEALALELETEGSMAEEQLRDREAQASRVRERTAARQSTADAERMRLDELDEEIDRLRRTVQAMTSRAGDIQSQWKEANKELSAAQSEHDSKFEVVQKAQRALQSIETELSAARERKQSQQNEHMQRMQVATELHQQIATHQSSIDAASSLASKTESRKQSVSNSLQSAIESADELSQQLKELESSAGEVGEQLQVARDAFSESDSDRQALNEQVIALKQKHAVIGERVALLEEIEKRMEGVGSGVKKLLKMQSEAPDGPLSAIRGMVADLIRVKDQSDAEMIAVALGDQAQHLVIAGTSFIDSLASGGFKVPGRVGFVRLQSAPPPKFLREVELDGQAGVIGRADRFVDADEEYTHLVQWLLGDSWLVETLDDAVQFHRSLNVPPRLVTRQGEVIERDGRLLVGPHALELGLIPRRAELTSLKEQVDLLSTELEKQQSLLSSADEELEKRKSELTRQEKEHDSVDRECARLRLKVEAAANRRDELQADFDSLQAEADAAAADSLASGKLLSAAQQEWQSIQLLVDQLASSLEQEQGGVASLESNRGEKASELTAAKVASAKSEQRLDALQARCEQMQRDQDEREQALNDAAMQMKRARERRSDSELAVLRATSEISDLHLQFESFAGEARKLIGSRDDARSRKSEHLQSLNVLRDRLRRQEQQNHEKELDAERIRHERGVLSDRLNEDYGIGVEQLNLSISAEEQSERDEVDAEISELRRKITNIGSVNMDALEELDDLESRHTSLSTQYQDLVDAKEALERIIQKINADSRRLFSETLEAIRENFKVLFRKVFGGGHADIILEQDVDILESGIDIMATPPGKNSLGLSLLSGGERALTAVALLMAIFQYRPSPFCVLDEVDAPLDDSNIGRFADVLREFLDWTKFVVVTHNKETMTAANTLYGITMQESGVSKRVSVRFEDVNEKGEISRAAVDRAAS